MNVLIGVDLSLAVSFFMSSLEEELDSDYGFYGRRLRLVRYRPCSL